MTSSSNSHQSDLNRSEPNRPDSDRRATRLAALTATLVALPITVLVAVLAIAHVTPDKSAAPDDDGSATPTPHATAPVPMTAHELDERAEVICRALLARLPLTIRELSQRPVTAGHEQNAAYGDPPITVACGVPLPDIPPTDLVYPLDKVCWHADERSDVTVWTTVDREVPVQVTVPTSYDEPGQWVIPFSEPIASAVPLAKEIPTGCGG